MRILLPVIFLAVVVLGVQSAAAAASADKSPPAPVTLEHTDNVASASVTAKSVTLSKNTKRSNGENEQIAAAESQHQYEDRHISGHHPRAQQPPHQPQQLISQSEYLAFVRENERAAAAQQETSSPHPYGKHPTAHERAPPQFYSRSPGHPLAGSSLEKEIEKLVNANAQQYAPAQQYIHEQHIPSSPQHEATVGAPVQQQFSGPLPQQQLRSPVVFKNHNDIVYIPYQQQLQRDQYAPRPGITKAKVQLISPYHSARTPFPSEAIEYGPGPHAPPPPPPPYGPPKPQESFKDLFIQQQRENHLKRLHSQQQHQQQQLAADNLNLQSHSQPLSISLLPKKQATLPPPPSPPPSHNTAEQPAGNSNFAQFAERLFKTPLDQQKPLSPEMFKALVAAGYPVQAVPVPVAVTRVHPNSPPPRYAPATAALASHPQPFTHPAKHHQSQASPVQYHQVSPQTHRHFVSSSPAHQQQPQPHHQQQARPETVHRFYAQGPYGPPQPLPQTNNPNTHTTYQLPGGGGGAGPEPYTYVLQQGENEETAAEQLRQQIIHEINAQSQNKGSGGGASPAAGLGRVEYQQSAAPQTAAGQGQTLATLAAQSHSAADSKPLTDEQKEYYKRLEYYSHNQ